MKSPSKLNLGCGKNKLTDGFVNIDIQTELDPDMVLDVRYLEGISDNSVDVIRADHVIEHFPHWQTHTILKLWFEKLKPGGQLEMSCPDLELIAQDIIDKKRNILDLMKDVYGGQDNPWNYHCAGFTKEFMIKTLQNAGFKVVKCEQVTVSEYRNLVIIGVKDVKV